jgi:hypothetical protein
MEVSINKRVDAAYRGSNPPRLQPPNYSTVEGLAFRLVGEAEKRGWWFGLDRVYATNPPDPAKREWRAEFYNDDGMEMLGFHPTEPAEAICRAWLATKDWDGGPQHVVSNP